MMEQKVDMLEEKVYMNSLFIKDGDIGFRPMDETDIDCLIELKHTSWNSTHNITILTPTIEKEWISKISKSSNSLYLMTIRRNESGGTYDAETSEQRIGLFKIININNINRSCSIAYDVFSSFRKKGYGTRIVKLGIKFIFEILNLRRIDMEILETNEPSLKIASKCGFICEGNKKKAVWKFDRYIDSFIFAKIKE
jgi:RimJ/RimL family protein N-acetyltransferase